MNHRTDELIIDRHTDTDTHTHAGNDNARRPKLASGKIDKNTNSNQLGNCDTWL